ncbi:TetR/AcrR family transcriptional regulator [Nocardia rhamnosiphila]|uniref:TetR/AcrR family transcriptional regulator n=1 Tax=Nocardia rhamnosiphila TaxID=426716 RepID=A0ABV2WW91_9NOCA|nr:TetR/AcrR family transcriptional regulator [Nocardia rhamnosiphila]
MTTRSRTDRRAPQRGDRRRSALLAALDELLRDNGGRLETVNIAEISRRAGLTRSAFYFYFENKAAAVAAALEETYEEVFALNDILVGAGAPAQRIERAIRGLVEFWDRHRHLYGAVLAVRSAPGVRELWESDRQAFIPSIAAMIDAERAAGRAPAGGDATAVADVLLLLNERLLERLTFDVELDRERYIESVVTVWLRSIYGTGPAAPITARNDS